MFKVICLFRSPYREVHYVRPFFECIETIQKNADLEHMCDVLCCRRRWAYKKVFITF